MVAGHTHDIVLIGSSLLQYFRSSVRIPTSHHPGVFVFLLLRMQQLQPSHIRRVNKKAGAISVPEGDQCDGCVAVLAR